MSDEPWSRWSVLTLVVVSGTGACLEYLLKNGMLNCY